jgi:hypothetical protein
VLTQGDEQLVVQVVAPEEAALEIYKTSDPPHVYDARNPGTRMLGFTVEVPASTETRWIVWLHPGEEIKEPPAVNPLSAW